MLGITWACTPPRPYSKSLLDAGGCPFRLGMAAHENIYSSEAMLGPGVDADVRLTQ